MAETKLHTEQALSTNVRCSVYLSANQTGVSSGDLVEFDTELYDTGSDFNTTTSMFTAPVAGYYQISGQIAVSSPTSGNRYGFYIRDNSDDTELLGIQTYTNGTSTVYASSSKVVYLAASTVIKMDYQGDESSVTLFGSRDDLAFMSIHLLST